MLPESPPKRNCFVVRLRRRIPDPSIASAWSIRCNSFPIDHLSSLVRGPDWVCFAPSAPGKARGRRRQAERSRRNSVFHPQAAIRNREIGFVSHIFPLQGPRLPVALAELGLFRTTDSACLGRPLRKLGSFCTIGPGQLGLFVQPARAGPRRQAAGRPSRRSSVANPQSPIRNPQSRNWVRFAQSPLVPEALSHPAPPGIGFVSHNSPSGGPADRRNWVRFAQLARAGTESEPSPLRQGTGIVFALQRPNILFSFASFGTRHAVNAKT